MPDPDLIDLIVCAPRPENARCRNLTDGARVVLRSESTWDLVPTEIATVQVRKRWRFGHADYVSGEVLGSRLDVPALGLTPLALHDRTVWTPDTQYDDEWNDGGQWSEAVRRPLHTELRWSAEMEQILPGADPDEFDTDPIIEAGELKDAGRPAEARELLGDLLTADLRCLDAHAHLGKFAFDAWPERALRHFRAGVAIGALSVNDPALVLPWGRIDNRPFLRCLHGLGLSHWKRGEVDEARRIFAWQMRLNPNDDQGVRFCLASIAAGEPWRP